MFFTSPTAARLLNGTFAWAELFSANLPSGVHGVYGVADQTLRQPGQDRRSVRAFLRLGAEPADDAPVAWYADAGVAWSGGSPAGTMC